MTSTDSTAPATKGDIALVMERLDSLVTKEEFNELRLDVSALQSTTDKHGKALLILRFDVSQMQRDLHQQTDELTRLRMAFYKHRDDTKLQFELLHDDVDSILDLVNESKKHVNQRLDDHERRLQALGA